MSPEKRAGAIIEALREIYPDAVCSLDYREPWQLLFSTRLAAQCTDKRVNVVAEVLYDKYKSIDALAEADIEELSQIIKPCGLFNTKARDLKAGAERLRDAYGGVVPDSMDELLTIPGIGRKTANLILSDVYGQPAIVADTHCIRLSNRFGLCDTKDPFKVEKCLQQIIKPEEQAPFCHRCVFFGRDICRARSPRCGECPISGLCLYFEKQGKAGL
jgi:endonuclease-3